MIRLTHDEITAMLLALAALLTTARLLGDLANRFNQPTVLGEILAGILLGPTVLGTLAPAWSAFLFPPQGGTMLALDGLSTLAIVLFLLVAGMEVELSTTWKVGKAVFGVSIAAIAIPFSVGFSAAWLLPNMLGSDGGDDHLIFALFFATAMSITALPVLAKMLMDLNLYRSDLGMIIIASAVVNDLVGWILFAVVLGLIDATGGHGWSVTETILLTLGYTAAILSVGRWLIHKALPWIQAHTVWPGGVLGFAMSLALFGAALTEWIGVHAVFGSFIMGIAIGDSPHLRERTRTILHQFISFIFAPLFFASIGLKVNFLTNFDAPLTLIVVLIGCSTKIFGGWLGAKVGGVAPREAWAVGFGMTTRGAMDVILGLLALQYALIHERMFVSLVVMAMIAPLISGFAIQRLVRRTKPRRFIDHLQSKSFVVNLQADTPYDAISALAKAVAPAAGLDAEAIARAVIQREHIMPTGISDGIAVPHARLAGLTNPVVGMGISNSGVDFDAADGVPSRLICMILTPAIDNGAQVQLLADIARTFKNPDVREKALQVVSYTEFRAMLKTSES